MAVIYWHYSLGLLRRYTSSLPKISGSKLEASGTLGEEPVELIGRETRLCPRADLIVVVKDLYPSCKSDANSLVVQPHGVVVTILT